MHHSRHLSASFFLVACFVLQLLSSCQKKVPEVQNSVLSRPQRGPSSIPDLTNATYSDWLNIQLTAEKFPGLYYGVISDKRITQEKVDYALIRMFLKAPNRVYDIPNPAFSGLYLTYSVGKIEIFTPVKWDIGYQYRFALLY